MVKMVDKNSPWFGRSRGSKFGFQAELAGLNRPLPIQIGSGSGRPCQATCTVWWSYADIRPVLLC